MAKLHRVAVADKVFWARSGEVLLDAAMSYGVDLPHDCRSGRCGSCLVRIAGGITVAGDAGQAGMVHACQARVLSDLTVECEERPPVDARDARVKHVTELTEDVVEVGIETAAPVVYLPGQYFRVTFRGFPSRPFSPTEPLDGGPEGDGFRLNIKRVRDGRVSPQLGNGIDAGHRVRLLGPFGHAFLRTGDRSRLVLVGSGTGFAPMWSIAAAALRENPYRHLWLIGAARRASSLYMLPALRLAALFPNVTAIASAETGSVDWTANFKSGAAWDHLPTLSADDIVYAAGGPAVVDRVAALANEVGSAFYSDPFESGGGEPNPMPARIGAWLRSAMGVER